MLSLPVITRKPSWLLSSTMSSTTAFLGTSMQTILGHTGHQEQYDRDNGSGQPTANSWHRSGGAGIPAQHQINVPTSAPKHSSTGTSSVMDNWASSVRKWRKLCLKQVNIHSNSGGNHGTDYIISTVPTLASVFTGHCLRGNDINTLRTLNDWARSLLLKSNLWPSFSRVYSSDLPLGC